MISGRHSVVVLTACAAVLFSACHLQLRRGTPPQRPGDTFVTLLPDPGDGAVGRAVVSNTAGNGTADLDSARESTRIINDRPPSTVAPITEAQAQALFGAVLETLPPAPHRFTLYFQFESEELTPESQALVPEVLQAVKDFPYPEIAVIGHTDTTGSGASNYELGLRRANVVRRLLLEAGGQDSIVEVTSHGEGDLLVLTPDDTPEPRNRRVEISVR